MSRRRRIIPLWLHRIREREHDRNRDLATDWCNRSQEELMAALNRPRRANWKDRFKAAFGD